VVQLLKGAYFLNLRQGYISRYEAILMGHTHSSLAIFTGSCALQRLVGVWPVLNDLGSPRGMEPLVYGQQQCYKET
jgi:hypothetical protein